MAFTVVENVQETTQTSGTGTLTLLGAISGAFAFSDQLSNSDTTIYVISDGTDIEIGIGTFTGPDQLSRDTVRFSTNGGSKVNWASSGTRNVYCALDGTPLSTLLLPSATGMVAKTAAATFANRTITGDSTIDVTNGDGVSGNPTVGVANDAVNLAQMAGQTRGDLITYDASGDPTTLAVGAANRVLGTTNGTDLSFFQIVTGMIADLAVTTAKLAAAAVTNAKLANMNESTIKGVPAGTGSSAPSDLTAAQVLAILGYESTSSTGNAIPAAGSNFSFAHGLSAAPNELTTLLRCTIADSPFAVGDVVNISSHLSIDGTSEFGAMAMADATNVKVVRGANNLNIYNETDGNAFAINTSNWVIDVYARILP